MRKRGIVTAVAVAVGTLAGAQLAVATGSPPATRTATSAVSPGAPPVGPGAAPLAAASITGPTLASRCTGPDLCVGAAKVSVTPERRFVDGVVEGRLGLAGTRLQRFHLGGYGLNPTQGLPDPDGSINDGLTPAADHPAFVGSHGPEEIWLRTMVIAQPGGGSVVLVTLDAIGAGNVIQEGLTAAVAGSLGLLPEQVLFGQTHSHAGPDLQGLWGGVPQAWIEDVLYPSAVAAARGAVEASAPAHLTVRQAELDGYHRYRRPARLDPDEQPDPTSTLLEARAVDDGRVLGSLLQYSAHPTSIDESVRVPHPDYVLGAVDWVERHEGGVALYFNGPIADSSPAGAREGCQPGTDGEYGTVRCRGEGIARDTIAAEPVTPLAPTLQVQQVTVTLPVMNPVFLAAGAAEAFNRYYDFLDLPVELIPGIGPFLEAGLVDLPQLTPTATTLVSRVTIGGADHGLELVTIPGEATGTFGRWIRDLAAPDARVALLGLTHSSFGYVLPEEEFSYLDESGDAGFLIPFTGYEEYVSLGPLTAPILRSQAYVPLFGAGPEAAVPPVLTACEDALNAEPCLLWVVRKRLDHLRQQLGELLPLSEVVP